LVVEGKPEEAEKYYLSIPENSPLYFYACSGLGKVYILQGKLRLGIEFWVKGFRGSHNIVPELEEKLWKGEDVLEKTILICLNEGIGDFFQAFRHIPFIFERGINVLLQSCDHSYMGWLAERSLPGVCKIYTGKESFDFIVPIFQIPLLCSPGKEMSYKTLPYLSVDPQKKAFWKFFFSKDVTFKVGIVWKGNPKHPNDFHRSTVFDVFLPLMQVPGCTFYGLQKGEAVTAPLGVPFVDLSAKLHNFDDTAAIVSELDLIISVDTSIVHLAGALGKPVWTLLGFCFDPRWMLHREDTPWYPTMRLFRSRGPKEWQELIQRVQKALELEVQGQKQSAVYRQLGATEGRKKNYELSILHLQKALDLCPHFLQTKIDLSVSLFQTGRLCKAKDLLVDVIKKAPGQFSVAYSNLGSLLEAEEKMDEAIEVFSQAVLLFPNIARSHMNLGLAYIKKGDLLKGWDAIRKAMHMQPPVRPYLPAKGWGGEEIQGKTLLIYTPEGMGDFFQFFRYLSFLQKKNIQVLIEMYAFSLMGDLVKRSLPQGIKPYTGKERFDVACSVLELGAICKTSLEEIPKEIPYLFPHLYKELDWKKFFAKDKNYKIGIVWKGNPNQINDYHRSAKLEFFSCLQEVQGCTFYGLQKGNQEEPPKGLSFIDLSDKLRTFDDTAAIISCLDLVISVDTSVVHLAGALGKPVWVLLGFHSGPYWMLHKEDSPWYPTARLFRSRGYNGWEDLMQNVKKALCNQIRDSISKEL
jgi:hypothetical protein